MKPYIVCCGMSGRCVVYGYPEEEPVQGEPCRLYRARMVLEWSGGGLFGVAQDGPREGSRLSAAVTETVTSACTEWLAVSDEAAEKIDAWPAC